MLTVGHRHRTEIGARGTVFVHIPASDHRHRGGRRTQPVRVGPAVLNASRVGGRTQSRHHLTEPELRALIKGPVRNDHLCDTGSDRQCGLLHRRRGRATAITDLAEELQLADACRTRDRGLQVRVHGEGHQAVDFVGRQTGIRQRIEHRLGRQPQLGSARLLREVGGTDTGNSGLTRQAHALAPIVSLTLAVTCAPRLLLPTTSTSTMPSSTAVTSPENTVVS